MTPLMQLLCTVSVVLALASPSSTSTSAYTSSTPTTNQPKNAFTNNNAKLQAAAKASATAALSLLLLSTDPSAALAADSATSSTSKMAAQIQLNSIPPTSIEINIRDLPLIGDVLSGTYTKASTPVTNPSVVIGSPKDKIGAIKGAATNGHLEFDVHGLLASHLDVDIIAEQAGVATVRVASPLIPQLPFKNPAANAPPRKSTTTTTTTNSKGGGTATTSEWFVVTNMGSGDSYYYNDKSGDTTFQKPKGF